MLKSNKRRLGQFRNTLLLNGNRRHNQEKLSWLNQPSLLVVTRCERTLASWRNRIQKLKSRTGRLQSGSPKPFESRTLTPLPKSKKKTVLIIRPLHRLSTSSVPEANLEQVPNPHPLPSPMCELFSHPFPDCSPNKRLATRTPEPLRPNLHSNIDPLGPSSPRHRLLPYSGYSQFAGTSNDSIQPQPQGQVQSQSQGEVQQQKSQSKKRPNSRSIGRPQALPKRRTPKVSELAFLTSLQDESSRKPSGGQGQLRRRAGRTKPKGSDPLLSQALGNPKLLHSRHAITPQGTRSRAEQHRNLLQTQAKLAPGFWTAGQTMQESALNLTTILQPRPQQKVERHGHYTRTLLKRPMHIHSSTYASHIRNDTVVVDFLSRTATQLESEVSLIAEGNKCMREACRDTKLSVLHNAYYLST